MNCKPITIQNWVEGTTKAYDDDDDDADDDAAMVLLAAIERGNLVGCSVIRPMAETD